MAVKSNSGWVLLAGVVAVLAVGTLADGDGGSPDPQRAPATAPQPQVPAEHRDAINAWIRGLSERQAASVRETCAGEAGCDPAQYEPDARPETTFGWDGVSAMSPTADWARGPRYHATANGRRLLVYLEGGRVVNVTLMLPDGGRRVLCRDEEC